MALHISRSTRRMSSGSPSCRFIIGDPFDRLIIAQALEERMPIVTREGEAFAAYGARVIW
jgi:PIN domain nuclease of toxin-antitoxin system